MPGQPARCLAKQVAWEAKLYRSRHNKAIPVFRLHLRILKPKRTQARHGAAASCAQSGGSNLGQTARIVLGMLGGVVTVLNHRSCGE